LEEKSREEDARALGLPEGTLSSRLARARTLLAKRLARRCPTLTGGALLAGLSPQATAAALPASLVQSTVKAGMCVLAGRALTAGVVSAQVALLSEGVVRAMFLTKLKIIAAIVCLGGLLTLGVGTVASRSLGTGDESLNVTAASKDESNPLLKQALEAARTVTDPEAKLRVLLRIATVQYKTGDTAGARKTRQEAFELAKSFPNGKARADALDRVAGVQIEAKDRDNFLETLRQVEQAIAAIDDANEKAFMQHRLISAQGAAGDFEGGLRTLANGGAANTNLVWMFANNVNLDDKEAARKILLRALETEKRIDEKRAIGERMRGRSSIAAALARAGDLEQALKIAKEMGSEQDNCLEVIAHTQAWFGDIAGAVLTAKPIEQADARADALAAIILAQAKAGDLKAARSTLDEVRALLAILQKAERARQPPRAVFQPRHRSDFLWPQIALTQLLIGDRDASLVTINSIDSDVAKAQALILLGENRNTAGKPVEAREFLVMAAKIGRQIIPDLDRRGRVLHSAKDNTMRVIAHEQARAGDVKEALKTAESITKENEQDGALAGIAPAQAEAGDLKGALETIARIRDEISKGVALEGVANNLVQTGHEKDAVDLAAKQASPAHKAYALLGVVLGKAKVNAPRE
jgi:hypothetical protein